MPVGADEPVGELSSASASRQRIAASSAPPDEQQKCDTRRSFVSWQANSTTRYGLPVLIDEASYIAMDRAELRCELRMTLIVTCVSRSA